jgi:hypothetical protein
MCGFIGLKNMKRRFRNIKELPGCPIGRIFKEDSSGNFYHSLSDEDAFGDVLIPYKFALKHMENKEWFVEYKDTYLIRSYNPNNFAEWKEVDTGIPTDLVTAIKKGLLELNTPYGNFKVTPLIVKPDVYDIQWSIIEYENGSSKLKYRVLIEKENEKNGN